MRSTTLARKHGTKMRYTGTEFAIQLLRPILKISIFEVTLI